MRGDFAEGNDSGKSGRLVLLRQDAPAEIRCEQARRHPGPAEQNSIHKNIDLLSYRFSSPILS